ncbi:MAG: molybdenum cofactor biosynthesis protein A [Syntrophaceae bacterium PtaU1.Bin231]|nr:MAG: molybdenum cofactor biosynthesis protein A [Syntrophaceae bacterium PtaU1.Bin231]HOG18036.1 radical SAM protein [Syntrophales bacterium]
MPHERIDLRKYLVVSIWFGCNNDCSICMLAGLKESLPPLRCDQYRRLLRRVAAEGHFRNLILSGAEVTMLDDLDEYVRFAASLRCFDRIQIQTNGRRLSDRRYLEGLIDCGVNEFFISIHGREEVHDGITRRPGSFRQTVAGLENLSAFDSVRVISNTVLSKRNCRDIPPLLAFLSQKRIDEFHLWNFFPLEGADDRDLVVSLEEFAGLLPRACAAVRPSGRPLVLKGFPECLPAEEPACFDSGFPVTVLPDLFWRKFGQGGFGACPRRGECRAKECWGLSGAYIRRYGDERDRLHPL